MYVIRECRGRAMSRCTSQLTSPIKSPITSSLSVDRAWVRQTRYASDSSSTCATGILIYDASCGSQCCWPMRQAVHHLGLGGDLPCQYSSPPFSARAPLIWVQYVVRSWFTKLLHYFVGVAGKVHADIERRSHSCLFSIFFEGMGASTAPTSPPLPWFDLTLSVWNKLIIKTSFKYFTWVDL